MDVLMSTRRVRSAGCRGRKLEGQELRCSAKRRISCSKPLLTSLGRSLVSEHWQESQCKFCRCREPDSIEFKKVVELEDVGVTIYRYMSLDKLGDSGPREIFLIQNSRGSVQLTSSNLFTTILAKCKTECPKCKEMLKRVERLLMTVPWVNRRGVAAVCDHLYQGDRVYCPPCNATADKFLSFITNEVRMRRNTSPTPTRIPNELQVEDAMQSALDVQASGKGEEIKKKGEEKRERDTRKRSASDLDYNTEESKAKKGREKQDLELKSNKKETGKEHMEEGKKNENEEQALKSKKQRLKKDKSSEQVMNKGQAIKEKNQVPLSTTKIGKQDKPQSMKTSVNQKMKSAMKLKSGGQVGVKESVKSFQKLTSKSQHNKSGSLDNKKTEPSVKLTENKATQHDLAQINLMRVLIAEQLKDQTNQDKLHKEQEKERDNVEKKAAEAEKRVRDAEQIARDKEEARRKKLSTMNSSITSLSNSPSYIASVIEECNDGADDKTPRMIKGEKICISKDAKTPSPPLSMPLPSTPLKPCPLPPRPPDTPKSTNTKLTKMNMYRMCRAHPEFDWFELNKHKRQMLYDSGEKLASFDEGRCHLYYRSGKLALDYYEAEEAHAGQRLVVYSTGERDAHGRARPSTVLAMFDYAGNGVVFDHAGNVRLNYNQTEGIILDRDIGPESHWKWHSLNDPPLLHTIVVDTQLARKDPTILKLGIRSSEPIEPKETDNSQMTAIEKQNFDNEHAKQMDRKLKYAPYKIRMKVLKINEQFSLKVLDQTTVYLNFCDGTTNLKINIGMVLDPTVIVSQEIAEVGEVINVMDKTPDTESVERLKEAVRKARATERARVYRERRLNPPTLRLSLDQLGAGLSRPLHTGLISGDTNAGGRFDLKPSASRYCSTINY